METNCLAWFSRNVRQVCEGGLRQRTMYLLTLVSPISMPSLSNSPWMRGAPQVGFSRHILRIRSRTSRGSVGLPGWPCRILHAVCRFEARRKVECSSYLSSVLEYKTRSTYEDDGAGNWITPSACSTGSCWLLGAIFLVHLPNGFNFGNG